MLKCSQRVKCASKPYGPPSPIFDATTSSVAGSEETGTLDLKHLYLPNLSTMKVLYVQHQRDLLTKPTCPQIQNT